MCIEVLLDYKWKWISMDDIKTYMADCNERRDFFVIVVTLIKISIRQNSELTRDKILKLCQNHHTVFLHRFVPIWSMKALVNTLFWSVTTHHGFWADITLTFIWIGENIFWPIRWGFFKCPHSPYRIHMVTTLSDFFSSRNEHANKNIEIFDAWRQWHLTMFFIRRKSVSLDLYLIVNAKVEYYRNTTIP